LHAGAAEDKKDKIAYILPWRPDALGIDKLPIYPHFVDLLQAERIIEEISLS